MAFTSRAFIEDIESISGALCYRTVFAPDTFIGAAGSGFELEARVEDGLDAHRALVDMELDRSFARFGRAVTTLSPSLASPELRPGLETTSAGTFPTELQRHPVEWNPFAIELPEQDSQRVRVLDLLPEARAMRRLAVLLFCAAALPAAGQETDPGRLLYETHCGGCHYERLHHRPPERSAVKSMSDLRRQVDKWAAQAKRRFTEEEREQVVQYLNRSHYRFPQ